MDLFADDEPVDLFAPKNKIQKSSSPKDLFRRYLREQGKTHLGNALGKAFGQLNPYLGEVAGNVGYGAIPFAEQVPQGLREGIKKSYAGITGSKFMPEPIPNEFGAQAGRSISSELSRGILGAPVIAGATALGGPLAGIAATGGYYGATTPGDMADRIIEGAEAAAVPIAGKAALSSIKGLGTLRKHLNAVMKNSKKENLVKSIIEPHDILEKEASTLYNKVRDSIGERNIKIPINEEDLIHAREYFPTRKRATNELFERAKNGDYKAIHDIQSSLYKKGTKQRASDDLVQENIKEDIIDLRNRINDQVINHLDNEMHWDISSQLTKAKGLYSELMNTYFNENLPASLKKMIHPDLRKIPENPEKILIEESIPIREFLEKHPKAQEHAFNIKNKKEAQKELLKILVKTGALGGLGAGTKSVIDLIK